MLCVRLENLPAPVELYHGLKLVYAGVFDIFGAGPFILLLLPPGICRLRLYGPGRAGREALGRTLNSKCNCLGCPAAAVQVIVCSPSCIFALHWYQAYFSWSSSNLACLLWVPVLERKALFALAVGVLSSSRATEGPPKVALSLRIENKPISAFVGYYRSSWK